MNILDIAIQNAGGVCKLASALGVKQNVVSNWRARGLPKPWEMVLDMRYASKAPATTDQAVKVDAA